jgi:Carbonic anhydrase
MAEIDQWLEPLRDLRESNAAELSALNETDSRVRLVELNVAAGVEKLKANPIIAKAVAARGLQVHGLVYDVACGLIRSLEGSNVPNMTAAQVAEKKEATGVPVEFPTGGAVGATQSQNSVATPFAKEPVYEAEQEDVTSRGGAL